MKKMVLSAAVVLALTVASCGNNSTTNNQEQTTETPVETAPVTASGTYTAEPTSVIEWKGSKPTGSHTGTIALQSGTFTVDNGKVSGDFVIDMNSITVTDHFFNVKTYPTGSFKLTGFDGTNATGDLTLKGKTKTISFPATLTITDSEVTLESQPFNINRVDYGVNYASKSVFGDLKDKFINDEIELVVKVKAKK